MRIPTSPEADELSRPGPGVISITGIELSLPPPPPQAAPFRPSMPGEKASSTPGSTPSGGSPATQLKDHEQHQETEKLCREILAKEKARLGPGHPRVAVALNNLAQLLQATNRLAEAEPLIRRAVKILLLITQRTGHPHPQLQVVLGNYHALLKEMGLAEEAIQQRMQWLKAEVAVLLSVGAFARMRGSAWRRKLSPALWQARLRVGTVGRVCPANEDSRQHARPPPPDYPALARGEGAGGGVTRRLRSQPGGLTPHPAYGSSRAGMAAVSCVFFTAPTLFFDFPCGILWNSFDSTNSTRAVRRQ